MGDEQSVPVPISSLRRIRKDITAVFDKTEAVADQTVFNILEDYCWTLSKHKGRKDIPYIWLKEFNSNETVIQKQINYYTQLLPEKLGALAGIASSEEPLDIYKEIFPHTDTEDCHQYIFPYFAKMNLELTTPNWNPIEPAGDIVSSALSKVGGKIVSGKGGAEASAKSAAGIKAGMDFLNTTANLGAMAQYPIVGALDRPRIFTQHGERNITISFPLFNTVEAIDWKKNQKFIHKLMNQNLMYKTSYVTGVPPVFYDVFIPGQYYCWASCVTNLQVENLGNMRLMDSVIVPDAYQVTLTLSEMVLPSKNQFDARFTGDASAGKVNVSLQGAVTKGAVGIVKSVTG